MKRTAIWLALTAVCVGLLLPFLWTLSTSLKPNSEIVTFPPRWIPAHPTLIHYVNVIHSKMPLYSFNTLLIGAATVLVTLFVSLCASYAITRSDFRYKKQFLLLMLAAMMMPGTANLVPLYLFASRIHLLDTYTILVLVYSAWLLPTAVWILSEYFRTIPTSLDNAAMVDGYSRWFAFWRVAVPLARPGLGAVAIIVFVYVWNEFIIALTLISSDDKRPVQIGLHYYITVLGVEWGEFTAAVILTSVPILIIFLLFQRAFISGLTSGALKG